MYLPWGELPTIGQFTTLNTYTHTLYTIINTTRGTSFTHSHYTGKRGAILKASAAGALKRDDVDVRNVLP